MKYIYGNWKMAQPLNGIELFFRSLKAPNLSKVEVAIFPTFVHLDICLQMRELSKLPLLLGAQDCSTEKSGAFTGEVSAESIREIGCSHILIGHSERRQRVPETPISLRAKVDRALEQELEIVFCIGETLSERESGKTLSILESQISVIRDLKLPMILAYEPVWAIGTGKTPKLEEVEEAHSFIQKIYPEAKAVLYGGSVKPENAREFLQLGSVGGLLVGGASLQSAHFQKIIEAAP